MSLFEAIGLVPDMDKAIAASQFDPYNIEASFGSLGFDEATNTFTSSLSPEFQQMLGDWTTQMQNIDPQKQFEMMQAQAAPYEQQQQLGLENRLFSQGLMQHSAQDQPGGARRSLFDSQQNAMMQRQLGAQDWASSNRQNLLNSILGIQGMESGLFNMGMGMGSIGMQGQMQASNLMGQQATAGSNIMGNVLGGLTMGAMI